MSIRVMTKVWDHSQHKGSALLLLLAIADHAHDDGGGAYPSIETLSKKIRMSERQTHYLIKKLAASGEIEIGNNEGPKGCNIYRVQYLQGAIQRIKGVQSSVEGGAITIAPEPSRTIIETVTKDSSAEASESFVAPTQKKQKSLQSIDAEFQDRMVIKYPELDVPFEIEAALNHKAVLKAINVERYVDTWLRKAQGYIQDRGLPNGRESTQPEVDPMDRQRKEKERVDNERKAHAIRIKERDAESRQYTQERDEPHVLDGAAAG